jgi:hypothetical protein
MKPQTKQELLWVHEDEEGLRCLYPAASLGNVSDDVRKAAEAGKKNRTADGFYTDIYIARTPRQGFAALGLRRADAIAALEVLLPRWPNFEVAHAPGAGTAEADAACFGFGADCMIYAVCRGELVDSFWFTAWTDDAGELAALRAVIEAIDRLSPAGLADYWMNASGLVADAAFLDRYFDTLTQDGEEGE